MLSSLLLCDGLIPLAFEKLQIVMVLYIILVLEYFGSSVLSGESSENAERIAREEAMELINKYLAKCQEAGVSVES